jgi:hypothetical protein
MESKENANTNHGELGELLYEYTARLTGFTEYGASMQQVLEGRLDLPPGGLRVDIDFAGEVKGPLSGHISGRDYVNIRADGRMELDIKATLTTPEGKKIAVAAGGVGIPEPESNMSLLRENVRLTSADPDFTWLNPLEIWAIGRADIGNATVSIRGYIPR